MLDRITATPSMHGRKSPSSYTHVLATHLAPQVVRVKTSEADGVTHLVLGAGSRKAKQMALPQARPLTALHWDCHGLRFAAIGLDMAAGLALRCCCPCKCSPYAAQLTCQ